MGKLERESEESDEADPEGLARELRTNEKSPGLERGSRGKVGPCRGGEAQDELRSTVSRLAHPRYPGIHPSFGPRGRLVAAGGVGAHP